jgi:hypothetical protein
VTWHRLFWLVRLVKPDLKAKEELMDVQNINAVGAEYGGMLRSPVAGDPEALGRLLSRLTDQLYYAPFRVLELSWRS